MATRVSEFVERCWESLLEVGRVEEVVLLGFLLVGLMLATSTNTGLDLARCFEAYSIFLIKFAGYTFVVIKPLMLANERWDLASRSPLMPVPARGGQSAESMLESEVELVRGGIIMAVTLSVYTNIKVRLPILADGLYDRAFLTADRWLFGEHIHRQLVQIAESSPIVTGLLDLAYTQIHLAFVILVGCLWMWGKSRLLRIFFLAYSFNYILGIIISVQFPSYGLFYFVPKEFAFLDHLSTGWYQSGLLRDFEQVRSMYEADGVVLTEPFSGITAFPSLHVAHMTVVALVGWRFSRGLAYGLFGFLVVGSFSTVALGWHYIMDGLAGCALGVFTTESAFWWVNRQTDHRSGS